MKRIYFLTFLISLLGLIPLGSCLFKKNQVAERPVIRVNDMSLSLKEFASLLASKVKNFDPIFIKDGKVIQQAKKQISQNYIHKALAYSFLRRKNISISSKDVTDYKKNIAQNYSDSLDLKRALLEQGLDYKTWEKQLRLIISERQVVEMLSKELIPLSEKEMKSYYRAHKKNFKRPERVKIRQIVLKTRDDAMRIRELLKRRSFNLKKLAKKYSIVPKHFSDEWIERGGPEVYKTAFSMRVGRTSPVLKSNMGYHIFKVIRKQKESQLQFSKVKDRIRRAILEDRQQAVYSAWLEEEIQSSRVYKDDMLIASIQVKMLRD